MAKGRSPSPWIQCSGFQGDASWPHSCCYLADTHGWSHPLIPAEYRPLMLCHTLLPACWFSNPPPPSDPYHLILSWLHGRLTGPWLSIQILGISVSRESKATATLHTQCCPSVASSLPLEPLSWGVSSHICLLHSHLCLSLSLPTVLWGLERETFSCIISSSATFAFMEKNIFSILSRKRPYESASANLNI